MLANLRISGADKFYRMIAGCIKEPFDNETDSEMKPVLGFGFVCVTTRAGQHFVACENMNTRMACCFGFINHLHAVRRNRL